MVIQRNQEKNGHTKKPQKEWSYKETKEEMVIQRNQGRNGHTKKLRKECYTEKLRKEGKMKEREGGKFSSLLDL